MFRNYLIILSFFLVSFNCLSQNLFQKTYAPFLLDMEQDVFSNDDIVIAGTNSDNNDLTIPIIRLNSCGNPIWSYQISTAGKSIQLNDLRIDQNDHILLAGNYFIRSGERNAFLISLNGDGTLNYFKVFDTGTADILYSMDLNEQNEVLLFFKTNINQAGPNSQNTVAKFNANGQISWIKEYGFTGVWGQMCATQDGGALVVDSRNAVKIDQLGDVAWSKSFSTNMYSEDHFEVPNGYVLFRYSISSSNISYPMMLDRNGNIKWNGQEIPNFTFQKGMLNSNGNLLLIGDMALGSTFNSPTIIEVDTSNGDILKTIIHQNNLPLATAFDLNELSDGSIVYCGNESLSFGGGIFLSRVDDTLGRPSCSDSILELNNPINTGTLSPATPWVSNSTNITITQPSLSIDNLIITEGQVFCSFNSLQLDLGKDTIICNGAKLTLSASNSFDGYEWSTGESSPSIMVDQAGEYALRAWLGCDSIADTIVVSQHPKTQIQFNVSTDSTAVLDTVVFQLKKPINYQSVSWYFGDGSISNSDSTYHIYNTAGQFNSMIRVTDSLGCIVDSSFRMRIDSLPFMIPNVFTPNNDGINDFFGVFGKGIEKEEIWIYDRWGKLVYQAVDLPWSGISSNGDAMQEGTYFYKIRFRHNGGLEEEASGSVSLLKTNFNRSFE